jgi:hypothetical protein
MKTAFKTKIKNLINIGKVFIWAFAKVFTIAIITAAAIGFVFLGTSILALYLDIPTRYIWNGAFIITGTIVIYKRITSYLEIKN